MVRMKISKKAANKKGYKLGPKDIEWLRRRSERERRF